MIRLRLLWLLMVLIFSGCGYHLKQPYQLHPALQNTHLRLALTSPLYQPLATALTNQGIRLVDVDSADALLVIGLNQLQKEIQSIGVNNRVQEYRLDYQLEFKLFIDDELLLDSKRLQLSKDYSFDIDKITGTQSEEQLLRTQLYEDMAESIIRYLANQTQHLSTIKASP